jgi:predicted permease
MSIASLVFFKTVSVLLSVVVGFCAGRFFKIDRDSVSSLLFYFISPIIFFAIPAGTTLTVGAVSLIVVIFCASSGISIFSYYFFGRYWQDYTRNIIALSAGDANVGYFTLPIAAGIFDDQTLGIYMIAIMGINLYEASVGLYIGTKNLGSFKENLIKLFKLPILNAFFLGCLFSILDLELPDFLDDFIYNMRGTYSTLGMIMVGLGVSSLARFEIDLKFTCATFAAKFLFYPIVVNLLIYADKLIFQRYDENYYDVLRLLAAAPMAGNLIIIAGVEKFYPERVAATVLASMLFALIYMPITLSLSLSNG